MFLASQVVATSTKEAVAGQHCNFSGKVGKIGCFFASEPFITAVFLVKDDMPFALAFAFIGGGIKSDFEGNVLIFVVSGGGVDSPFSGDDCPLWGCGAAADNDQE